MCSNYRPVTDSDRLLRYFGVVREKHEEPVDCWPTGLAPFIRLSHDGSGFKQIAEGHFGLVPGFQTELAAGRRTYNARTETVARLPSFREAWRKGWRCIIPAEAIYEPSYESGKAVRWRISLPVNEPMGIAGIYAPWTDPHGIERLTFAMLTVNADGHPVMQRFHKPGEEKRMVVILDPKDFEEWLTCSVEEAPKYFTQWMGPLETESAALPPRIPVAKTPPEPPTAEPGLF
ncbi:MAG: SOS response-associated peptidase family protein [Burkholderiaceae bacterium]